MLSFRHLLHIVSLKNKLQSFLVQVEKTRKLELFLIGFISNSRIFEIEVF